MLLLGDLVTVYFGEEINALLLASYMLCLVIITTSIGYIIQNRLS
jgi:hypothetical protein